MTNFVGVVESGDAGLSTAHDMKPSCSGRDDSVLVGSSEEPIQGSLHCA